MQKQSCLALTTLLAIAIPNPGLSHVPLRLSGNFTRLDAEPNLKIKAASLKFLIS
ncbi:MAG: hypothetical protein V7L11_06455 [Nostoc sp.]|uniref:hypothetical protein n=1 Tax=Nostoc sp. TaxID=1180 RepID=UPI002FF63582